MDLHTYRQREVERHRASDLLRLVPPHAVSILDAGARDGHLSGLLANRVPRVVALDLLRPAAGPVETTWICGDLAALPFADASFDVVVCAEVLEHLNGAGLVSACAEIRRVARRTVVVGVPFEQDLRIGRTTCRACGHHNPPYGHVNRFTVEWLSRLFLPFLPTEVSYVGSTREITNGLSSFLMDLAGNPWGTYDQAEPCVHCGAKLSSPGRRSILQRALAKAALVLNELQTHFRRADPAWVHVVFDRVAEPRAARPVNSAASRP